MIITFLIRLALTVCTKIETRALSYQCIKLLEQALEIWKEADVKFSNVEKVLQAPTTPEHQYLLSCVLSIADILVKNQSASYLEKNVIGIQNAIDHGQRNSKDERIRKTLGSILNHFVRKVPPPSSPIISTNPPQVSTTATTSNTSALPTTAETVTPATASPNTASTELVSFMQQPIIEFYAYIRLSIDIALKTCDQNNIPATAFVLLEAVCKEIPSFIQPLMDSTVKCLVKLTNMCLVAPQQQRMPPSAGSHREFVPPVQATLNMGLQILHDHLEHTGESKKAVAACLALLIGKSQV